MFRDSIIAAIRTGVASLVGIAIAWLVNLGVEVPDDFQTSLNAVLLAAIILGYNLVVSLLERRVSPLFGLMLGIPKAPAYGSVGSKTPGGATPQQVDAALDYVSPEVATTAPPPPGEAGNVSLITAGAVIAIVGVIVAAATTLGGLGTALIVVGAVLLVAGAVLELTRGRGSRL